MTLVCHRWRTLLIPVRQLDVPSDPGSRSVPHNAAYRTTRTLTWRPSKAHARCGVVGSEDQGFDFSKEDRVDPEQFNRVIWQGLMATDRIRRLVSGADLRQNREQLLKAQSRTDVRDSVAAAALNRADVANMLCKPIRTRLHGRVLSSFRHKSPGITKHSWVVRLTTEARDAINRQMRATCAFMKISLASNRHVTQRCYQFSCARGKNLGIVPLVGSLGAKAFSSTLLRPPSGTVASTTAFAD